MVPVQGNNTICLASSSNTGSEKEGGIRVCGDLEDVKQKGAVEEAPHRWFEVMLIYARGEDKNKCKHSVSWKDGVGKNAHEGHEGMEVGRVWQRRGEALRLFTDTIRYTKEG